MRACERFLKYIRVHTTSDPASSAAPSSAIQLDLAHMLVEEMTALGIENAHVDEFGVVYGWLSATKGCEDLPALGFIAHMDTSPDYSGENVKPQIHANYDGGDVVLPGTGDVLTVESFPTLPALKGMTLITSDGTTLLGADDKAGIAEILTAVEAIVTGDKPHGRLCIAFTPDEEIGRGADRFDVKGFGADFAYTVDGDELGGIEYENFNAASAQLTFHGRSVHPGSAKNKLVNAALLAMEFDSLLPPQERPEHTEGYEGFYHLCGVKGETELAESVYILRDHDRARFEVRKATVQRIAAYMNEKYGAGTVECNVQDSYYNMREVIEPRMDIIRRAENAYRAVGVTPFEKPIRGGTDGSKLSFMGLPCPNLATGGMNYHGRFECIAVQDMDKMAEMLVALLTLKG